LLCIHTYLPQWTWISVSQSKLEMKTQRRGWVWHYKHIYSVL
jgi:hypothetical protein